MLRSNDGSLYGGTLVDEDMEYAMMSHTWKFGSHSMRDVFVLAILESVEASEIGLEPLEPILNMARTLHGWFPGQSTRITPIAMYRRLNSPNNREFWEESDSGSAGN